ncbi:MAG TPA: glucose-6-phosphate dehydrogenase, partial [Actinomycetota bacterium]|nr:glucose-6-phosphate dehydrogenase [Actinomycetota bacterium]
MAKELLPQAAVIYGASGDLTQRKLLPAFWHLWLQRRLPKGFALVGYARSAMTSEEFRQSTYDHVRKFSKHPPEGEAWDEFARRLSYYRGEFSEPGAMNDFATHLEKIDAEFGTQGRRIFDAAVPPTVYADIVRRIGEAGLQRDAKIVLEKPFGRDLQSARELNEVIHSVFDETQVFRIDHYLGKETVQNILAFRFANGMFEPIWNRRYIDHVQITVAESIGVEGRGGYFEEAGIIRDMIQNHLMQVLTLVAMEPPASLTADAVRDEKVKVLKAIRSFRPDEIDDATVRAQYTRGPFGGEEVKGYREEEG